MKRALLFLILLAFIGTICIPFDVEAAKKVSRKRIAYEGGSFSFVGTKTVRFGTKTRYVEKKVTNSGLCTKRFFGSDPAPYQLKECSIKKTKKKKKSGGGGGGGGSSSSATTPVASVTVNGTCGSSHGASFSSTPSANLCTSGTASNVTGSGPYVWSCTGSSGGSTANCSASSTAGIATALTLSGPSSGTVSTASTDFTVGADGTISGTVVVTPSSNGGGGSFTPTTLSLTSSTATGTFTYTPASTGSKTISITNNAGLTNPSSLTYTSNAAVALSSADWTTRSTAAGVVWSHGFERDEEVTAFARTADPMRTIWGVQRVVDESGLPAMEQIVVGGTLAAPYTAGDPTMTLVSDYLWPDPASIGPYYVMAFKQYPDATVSKNLFQVTAKVGNVISVTYDASQEPWGLMASSPQNYTAGDYIGNEEMNQWIRTFSPLQAGDNGKLTDDLADGGLVGLRSTSATGPNGVPRDLDLWGYGNYMHPDNATIWESWTPWRGATTYTPRGAVNGPALKHKLSDGSKFYLAFKHKVDPAFWANHTQPLIQANGGSSYWGRKTWAVINEASTYNELVASISPSTAYQIPATNQSPLTLATNKAQSIIGLSDQNTRTNPTGQFGSSWHVAPWYADLTNTSLPATGAPTPDGAGAWEMPAGEWVDFLITVEPGHSQVADTKIKLEFARTEDPSYTGTWTTLLNVTDAKINFSSVGDYVYPDGVFSYPGQNIMDILPGFSAFWFFGYLNIWQSWDLPPPKYSYYNRIAEVIFSRQAIAPPQAALPSWVPAQGEMKRLTVGDGVLDNNFRDIIAPYFEKFYDVAIINDYSGMVLAPDIGNYGALVAYGGGHSGTNNGQVMALVPDATGLSWVSLTNPTAWTGSTATDDTNKGNNSQTNIVSLTDNDWGDAFPFDGTYTPPGEHSYSGNVIIPNASGGATYGTLFSPFVTAGGTINIPTAGGPHTLALNSMSDSTQNVWSRFGSTFAGSGTGWSGPKLAAFVPSQNRVYYSLNNAGSTMHWYDLTSDTRVDGNVNGPIHPEYNSGQLIHVESKGHNLLLYVVRDAGAVRIQYIDLDGADPQINGTATLSLNLPVDPFEAGKTSHWVAAAWSPDNERLIVGKILTAPGDLRTGATLDEAAVYEIEVPTTLSDPWPVTRRVTTGVTNIGWDVTTWQQPIYMPRIKSWVLFQKALRASDGNDSILIYRPLGT